jgi:hypothetical protein
MRRTLVLVAAIIVATIAPRAASAQASVKPQFDALAFLAGSCWIGTFKGKTTTDEHCFQWIYGGKFLRDQHVVRGDSVPYQGETVFAWDPEKNRIVYWYIALPGFHSTGHVEVKDGTITFVDLLNEKAGKRDLVSTWRRSGPNSFTVLTEDRTGGVAKEMWSMEMHRSRQVLGNE